MRTESFPDAASENATWTYATSGKEAGQLTRETKANGYVRTLGYNTLGEAITDTETFGGTAWSMSYAYDTLGRMATLTYPGTAAAQALKVAYGYDGLGNLTSVTNVNDGTAYWQADTGASIPAVSAWGVAEAWTLGNGVDVERDRDPGTGAVMAITAGPSHSASRVSLSYGYDTRGNTHTTADLLTNVSRTLTYGNLSRLARITLTNPNGTYVYSAGYDAAGDIKSRSGVGTYDYTGAQPHAVTQTTLAGVPTNYAYNDLGQMTSGGSLTQIQWTQAGRASQIQGSETATLAYDTDGNLLQKAVSGGTTTRYFGQLFVKVGSGWRERIVANGEVIAIVNVSITGYVTTDYMVHDNEGSPAVLLDASGNLAARFAWNAWGELVDPMIGFGHDPDATQKEALTTLGYTGHEMFWQAGLVQTWARLYNPAIGRWLSPDPTVPDVGNGQAFNRYSYVLNNPLSYTDPLGLKDLSKITVWGNKPCPSGGIPILDTSTWEVLDCVSSLGSGGGGSGAGSNNGSGGGGNGNSGNNNSSQNDSSKKNPCTAARQEAAELAKSLEKVSNIAGGISAGGLIGLGISAVGEVPSAGGDTEATIGFATITKFAGLVSTITGASAAALNSFAAGNLNVRNQ